MREVIGISYPSCEAQKKGLIIQCGEFQSVDKNVQLKGDRIQAYHSLNIFCQNMFN
jgi:hypothetical protein